MLKKPKLQKNYKKMRQKSQKHKKIALLKKLFLCLSKITVSFVCVPSLMLQTIKPMLYLCENRRLIFFETAYQNSMCIRRSACLFFLVCMSVYNSNSCIGFIFSNRFCSVPRTQFLVPLGHIETRYPNSIYFCLRRVFLIPIYITRF